MGKAIKLIAGVLVVAGIGFFYGKLQKNIAYAEEETFYS